MKYVACAVLLYKNDVLIPSLHIHTQNFTFNIVGNNAKD